MISSVSGGIVAELGGGKFANGAMTAAFVSLYNHGSSAYEGDDYSIDRGNGKGYFHDVPLGSSTPVLGILGVEKLLGWRLKILLL